MGVEAISEWLGLPVFRGYSLEDGQITGVASLLRAGPSDLSFCTLSRGSGVELGGTKAGLLLVDAGIEYSGPSIVCESARLSFIRAARHFFPPAPPKIYVTPTANVHGSAVIGS